MSIQILHDDDEYRFRQYYDPEQGLLCGPYDLVDVDKIGDHFENMNSSTPENLMDTFAEITRMTRDLARHMHVSLSEYIVSQSSSSKSSNRERTVPLEPIDRFTGYSSSAPTSQDTIQAPNNDDLQKMNAAKNQQEDDISLEEYDIVSPFEISRDYLSSEQGGLPCNLLEYHRISLEIWESFFDNHIMVQDEFMVRKQIAACRLEPCARKHAWPYLLKVFEWHSSKEERDEILNKKRIAYDEAITKWTDIIKHQGRDTFAGAVFGQTLVMIDSYHRIEKDIVRTDQALSFYSSTHKNGTEKLRQLLMTYIFLECQDIGYVQGMADLASVMLMTVDGDVHLAYLCFARLMVKRRQMFASDGKAMQTELDTIRKLIQLLDPGLYVHLSSIDALNCFFSFRWFLVLFRREFPLSDSSDILDVILSSALCQDMHYFVALAILINNRDVIISQLKSFDEVLKYSNDLSMRMNVDSVLFMADRLFHRFQEMTIEKGWLDPFEPHDLSTIPVSRVLDRLDKDS